MKYVKNEKGSAAIYLLWIMTVIVALTLIIVNIARVYIVKQQASTAAELGAFAATSEILDSTEDIIKDFDREVMVEDSNEPLWDEIDERIADYVRMGKSEQEAYIKALNEVLPGRLSDPILNGLFKAKFTGSTALSTDIYNTVRTVIRENEGNEEHLEIVISKEKYRVEVKTDATYKTITDGKIIDSFTKDIPQIGYGPKLSYLQYVLN